MVFDDLKKNEYYIHKKYGVCQFLGIDDDWVFYFKFARNNLIIEKKDIDEQLEKYLIVYDGDRENIKLDRLAGDSWRNAKLKARKEAQKMAKDLMDIAAKRSQQKGFEFSKDTEKQIEFEQAFPYQITLGQVNAINDIKQDMESDKIMNRIIVGDVGCGKTEVAMRVTFKAIQDNKQVALLAPSVILAKQHFEDFKERFKGFNVNIGFLSSISTAKEKRETIQGVADGTIQILIGTHSIVSDKVIYKNIGLLICDEEHKFGKMCKNSLMKFRSNIDYLSMTATPIPQSYFKLSIGLLDVSIIDTFPNQKQPIDTNAVKWNDNIIKQYINRELDRDGQIFFIDNNIENLEPMKERLINLIPSLKIGIVHSKLKPKEIDDVMNRFRNKEYDLLVATSVIEVGITIKNANTIILYNAQSFGLQQAHQIRGRVGRGDRKGYCLLVSEVRNLNDHAKERLKALEDNTALGCGIKLSEIDCKLRGAGDLLGIKQSGKKYRRIGYTLYNEILNQVLREEHII